MDQHRKKAFNGNSVATVTMSDKSSVVDELCFNHIDGVKWKDARASRSGSSHHQSWMVEDVDTGVQYEGTRQSRPIGDSAYYALFPTDDGGYQAMRVGDKYRFKRVPRYKQLSIEEAEAEFNKREKVLNHFQIMATKRFRDSEEAAAAAATAATLRDKDKRNKRAKTTKKDKEAAPSKNTSANNAKNVASANVASDEDDDTVKMVDEDDRVDTEVMDYKSESSDTDDGDLIAVDHTDPHDEEKTENYFSSMFNIGNLSDSENEES